MLGPGGKLLSNRSSKQMWIDVISLGQNELPARLSSGSTYNRPSIAFELYAEKKFTFSKPTLLAPTVNSLSDS